MIDSRTIQEILNRQLCSMDKDVIDEMAIPSYTHWNPLVRWIIRKRLAVIARQLKLQGARRYLDFGCGLGVLELLMASSCDEMLVTDLELEPAKAIHRHFKLKNIQYLDHDRLEAQIPKGSLDAIVAADVLEHIDNIDSQAELFRRLLKPTGFIFLSGPTETSFYKLCRKIARFSGEYHVRNIYDIEQDFTRNGFRLVRKIFLPMPGPFQMFSLTIWSMPQ